MKINEIGEFGLIDILKQNTINNKDNIIKKDIFDYISMKSEEEK